LRAASGISCRAASIWNSVRFNQLLKDAQRVALSLKDEVRATDTLEYTLPLTSSRLRSLAQWVLFDPAAQAPGGGMQEGEGAPIDLDTVGDLVAQSEIDFRVLRANIRAVLRERSQASIGEVMSRFPATQGWAAWSAIWLWAPATACVATESKPSNGRAG